MTLDYGSPTPRRQIFSVAAFLAVGIPLLFLYAVMFFVILKFEAIFADFGTKLPAITSFVIAVARIGTSFRGLPALLLPFVAGFVYPMFVQSDPTKARSRKLIATLLVLIVLLVLLLIVMIALFAPMLSLIQNISSPKR